MSDSGGCFYVMPFHMQSYKTTEAVRCSLFLSDASRNEGGHIEHTCTSSHVLTCSEGMVEAVWHVPFLMRVDGNEEGQEFSNATVFLMQMFLICLTVSLYMGGRMD